MIGTRSQFSYLFGLLALIVTSAKTEAALVLTGAGNSAGFTLSTFSTGFPTLGPVGPLGIVFLPSGQVMVSDYPGNVRIFPNAGNNQTAGSAPIAQNYGGGNAVGLVQVGSNIYMTQQSAGRVVQVNANGTFNSIITSSIPGATGIVANPVTGHLYISTGSRIFDLNPSNGVVTIPANNFYAADGLSITPDGSTLYAALQAGSVIAINTTTFATTATYGVAGGPDGTALGTGTLAGNLYVNTNAGQVIQINLTTAVQTIIATGGTRGDFVAVDPFDGSLFLTQTTSIERLTGPAGGGFGNSPAIPEPSTFALLGMFLAMGFGAYRWRIHTSLGRSSSLITLL